MSSWRFDHIRVHFSRCFQGFFLDPEWKTTDRLFTKKAQTHSKATFTCEVSDMYLTVFIVIALTSNRQVVFRVRFSLNEKFSSGFCSVVFVIFADWDFNCTLEKKIFVILFRFIVDSIRLISFHFLNSKTISRVSNDLQMSLSFDDLLYLNFEC